jgi:hypothetical protein
MYKLTGQIKVIGETIQVTEKFAKREIVVTDNTSMYPQDISLQFTQDKCDILDQYNVGDSVEVSFNLRGREWTSPQGEVKYFNTLDAWRIEKLNSEGSSGIELHGEMAQAHIDEGMASEMSEEDDDLPF